MNLTLSTKVRGAFDEVVERAQRALWEQGFGVLTEIDMRATLHAKLGKSMEDYVILGTCNPALADRTLAIDRQIGVLLPCNIVVRTDRTDPAFVVVEAMNPQLLVDLTGEPALRDVADEINAKLQAAIDSLSG